MTAIHPVKKNTCCLSPPQPQAISYDIDSRRMTVGGEKAAGGLASQRLDNNTPKGVILRRVLTATTSSAAAAKAGVAAGECRRDENE